MPTTSTLTKLVAIPTGINVGVSNAKQATMLGLLGNPRNDYDDVCRQVTNPTLKARIELASVGPFRVQGLKPAVASLKEILSEIAVTQPDLHAGLGSAGMLCARLVRNTTTHAISNHSWGSAIDLTLTGSWTRAAIISARGLTSDCACLQPARVVLGRRFLYRGRHAFRGRRRLIRKWQPTENSVRLRRRYRRSC